MLDRMAKRVEDPTGAPGADRATGPDQGLSSLATGYRQAEPYMAASSALIASVAGFTALGYGLDRWLGHTVQWLLLVGAVVGIGVGFTAFFTKIAAATHAAARRS